MLMHDKELAALLSQVKTVAVIGAVDKPGRPVNMVGHALISMGYTVIPIHPKRRGVWGLTTYPSINDVPIPIDVVDLFRSSDFCPDHAREVLEMRSSPLSSGCNPVSTARKHEKYCPPPISRWSKTAVSKLN